MKLVRAAALAAFVASCSPVIYKTPYADPFPLPPDAPLRLLRKPADFRIRDVQVQKEYFLHYYEDADLYEEVVTVADLTIGADRAEPRLASPEEHARAIELFTEEWKERNDDEKYRYFTEKHEQEMRRNATIIDEQIRLKREVLDSLERERHDLKADLEARRDTKAFTEPVQMKFLEEQVDHKSYLIGITDAELQLLEYKRALRDAEYLDRPSPLETRSFPVEDLLPYFSEPERLSDEIRTRIRPKSWEKGEVTIKCEEGALIIRHHQRVLREIGAYLDGLRERFAVEEKE